MENNISNQEVEIVNPAEIELIPEELRNKVVTIQCESEKGMCNVYLIGTCHVSSQSKKDVEALVSFSKPEAVFLELCERRTFILDLPDEELQELPGFTHLIMVDLWKSPLHEVCLGHLYNLVMRKVGRALGVVPGSEFRSAYREANKYGGKVVLGDRPREITSQRTWSKMSFLHKAKFVFMYLAVLITPSSFARYAFNKLSESDIEKHAQLEDEAFPSMAETLIYERDLFMASKLFEVAKECESVVAVVGLEHVTGIQKYWKKPIAIESLLEFHEPAKSSPAVKLLTAVALAAIGMGLLFCLKTVNVAHLFTTLVVTFRCITVFSVLKLLRIL